MLISRLISLLISLLLTKDTGAPLQQRPVESAIDRPMKLLDVLVGSGGRIGELRGALRERRECVRRERVITVGRVSERRIERG